jgi:hypothetical protein
MKRPLKVGLISGIVAMVMAGSVVAAFAKTENDFFQFCTTKAYGWPAPWRIDYCECEGSKTTFPTTSKIVNFSMIAGSGIAGFALFGGISTLRNRQEKQKKQNKPVVATADNVARSLRSGRL